MMSPFLGSAMMSPSLGSAMRSSFLGLVMIQKFIHVWPPNRSAGVYREKEVRKWSISPQNMRDFSGSLISTILRTFFGRGQFSCQIAQNSS